jgi:serine/threonine-protein kinase
VTEAVELGQLLVPIVQPVHDAGWVHGDIQPPNVMCTSQLSLVDLGFAVEARTENCGQHAPDYAPPELVLSGQKVTASADTFMMAGVVYRALTGTPPFRNARSNRLPPSPKEFGVQIPGTLVRWFNRAFHADPKKRFQTAAEFGESLSEVFTKSSRRESLLLGVG